MTDEKKPFRIALISLGCDKNTVDSEEMLGILADRGYSFTELPEEADAVIVNTCCFIGDALEESISTVLSAAELKKTAGVRFLVVTGCMSERFKNEAAEELPEVDAFVGTTAFPMIAEVLDRLRSGETGIRLFPDVNRETEENPRFRGTGQSYTGYLKIAEGCDKKCTYCAIPGFRGRYRSFPMNRLVKTARELVEGGVRELILVAQETTVYGKDLYGKKSLPELLRRLSEIENLQWIRLLYCYPEEIDEELIEAIRILPKVLHYIDMPLQHTEDHVLQRMGRRLTKAGLIGLVEKLREKIPDIALRTTLITGFPGETEEEHEALMETLNQLEFDRLGVFPYSREDGTVAAGFPDQIPEEVKLRYRDEIMELQQEISLDKNLSMVGKTMEIIVEGYLTDEEVYVGRSYRDAPEVDGLVFFPCERDLIAGTILPVKIISAAEYDLTGEPAE